MPYFEFVWTADNEDHVGQHGITFEEFLDVALYPEAENRPHRFPNRVKAFGWTSTGRYIAAIYDVEEDGVTAIPVTAFEVKEP